MQSNFICSRETLFDAEQFYLQQRNVFDAERYYAPQINFISRRETLFAAGNFIYFCGLLGHGNQHMQVFAKHVYIDPNQLQWACIVFKEIPCFGISHTYFM